MPEPSDTTSDDPIDDAALASIVDAPAQTPSLEAEAAFLHETSDLNEEQKRVLIQGQRQDIQERKKYALHILRLVVGWLGLMAYILLAQGYRWWAFELSEKVLIAVVTTTTGGVVGLLVVVVKYLFPTPAKS